MTLYTAITIARKALAEANGEQIIPPLTHTERADAYIKLALLHSHLN